MNMYLNERIILKGSTLYIDIESLDLSDDRVINIIKSNFEGLDKLDKIRDRNNLILASGTDRDKNIVLKACIKVFTESGIIDKNIHIMEYVVDRSNEDIQTKNVTIHDYVDELLIVGIELKNEIKFKNDNIDILLHGTKVTLKDSHIASLLKNIKSSKYINKELKELIISSVSSGKVTIAHDMMNWIVDTTEKTVKSDDSYLSRSILDKQLNCMKKIILNLLDTKNINRRYELRKISNIKANISYHSISVKTTLADTRPVDVMLLVKNMNHEEMLEYSYNKGLNIDSNDNSKVGQIIGIYERNRKAWIEILEINNGFVNDNVKLTIPSDIDFVLNLELVKKWLGIKEENVIIEK